MVTAADVNKADRVVTLGCKLPDSVGRPRKTVDWNDVSSPSKDYDSARTDVVRYLEQLQMNSRAKRLKGEPQLV